MMAASIYQGKVQYSSSFCSRPGHRVWTGKERGSGEAKATKTNRANQQVWGPAWLGNYHILIRIFRRSIWILEGEEG